MADFTEREVGMVLERLKNISDTVARVEDAISGEDGLEKRVRKVEGFKAQVTGALILLSGAFTALGYYVVQHAGG